MSNVMQPSDTHLDSYAGTGPKLSIYDGGIGLLENALLIGTP
jgi:hypothetical protein